MKLVDHDVKTHSYRAYGINIRSAVPLPDLISTDSDGDVRIAYGKVLDSQLTESLVGNGEVFERPGLRVQVTANAMCITWDRVGTFLVYGGSDVLVEPGPGVLEEDLQPFLTGSVLSVLLHQRGFLVLHASAVAIGNVAVAFLGSKGDGKSTLAAHLQVRGHELIADDIVPVYLENGRPVLVAGFPRIKLYNDSITAVGEEPLDYPLIHRFVEKRSFKYSTTASTEPIPLHSIYVLSEGEDVGLEQFGDASAFIELTRHTYVNRYLKALDAESKHFQQCQQLVKELPVWRLDRPHDFSVMNSVCELIENNVRPQTSLRGEDLAERSS